MGLNKLILFTTLATTPIANHFLLYMEKPLLVP